LKVDRAVFHCNENGEFINVFDPEKTSNEFLIDAADDQ
jgi:hypothetical protein